MRNAIGLIALLLTTACGSAITSVSPMRVAPGETFTIHGRRLSDNLESPAPRNPVLARCGDHELQVISRTESDIVVRVPMDTTSAVYSVQAFGVPLGAYERPRTNGVPIWVTAAPVPASVTDAYEVQVRAFRTRYGKSAEWQAWLLANRSRYQNAFNIAHAAPCPMKIAVTYATPIPYNPPWASVDEHMSLLEQAGNGAFAGDHLDFSESYAPADSYAHAILGVPGNSNAGGSVLNLHFETIFNHEFGHIMGILHHYDTLDDLGNGQHFPPGETGCVMDRNRSEYCSACRTALNVPLDVNNTASIDAAITAIATRYPPGF